MRRREFFALAAAAPALGAVTSRQAGRVETVFKSPGPRPNGLQATEDGKVLREFATEADRASGITFDGQAIWLASTYSREIIRADASSGKTLEKYYTPGAGVIYRMPSDPPGRASPLAERSATPAPPARGPGRDSTPRPGTGAHGLEWRDGKLWVAVPPSRTIYRIDPETWLVERQFPTVGNRPHGIGWEDKWLWCTDSNLNAFFKHDPATGEVIEKIQLGDQDPCRTA